MHDCQHIMAMGPAPDRHVTDTAARLSRSHTPVIDMHCHIFTPEVEDLVADHPARISAIAQDMANTGADAARHNQLLMGTDYLPKFKDVNVRLNEMDHMGVTIQAISPSPAQYHQWAPMDLADQIVRLQNHRVAETCALAPNRFVGLGTVALQHPQLIVEQLDHAMLACGLRGVEITSHGGQRELSDRDYNAFWTRAEDLGALVFLHPMGTSLGPRLNRYYLSNVIGNPLETTVALSHLIFSGLFDRHPRLKLLAAHGGGYLPSYIGRHDHAYRARPEAQISHHRPSEYLKRIWFDTLVYEPDQLQRLIDVVSPSQVVLGTDYPYDMGSYDIDTLFSRLSEPDRLAILGGNAAQLLGLNTQ